MLERPSNADFEKKSRLHFYSSRLILRMHMDHLLFLNLNLNLLNQRTYSIHLIFVAIKGT